MFLYGPGDYTPIHDHSSWGVSGSALGNLGVLKYCRKDNGSADGYARLIQTETLTLTPGETDVTFPLDRGIHQTGNPTENTIIMISIYGSPMRRLYVNRFDLRENRIFKLYPPRLKKKMLAAQALKNFKAL
jgi:predicted metal-dependent enzyme (double-stranded beta helix superfamily)